MDNPKQFTAIEWCAGYGGIHLGLKRAIRNLRVIAYGEIEAFACANLVSKMEAGLMDEAPIWSDLKTFPCEEFRDRVDLLVAGYPCQPFSAAGKRLGTEDTRHLWPHIAGSIRVIRPRLCFFENVEGHISLGLSSVISDLEELGYKVSWGIFSAREVGAPHQRKRVFILAYDNNQRLEGFYNWHTPSEQAEYFGANSWAGGDCTAWPSRPGEPQHEWEPPRVVGAGLANTNRGRDTQSEHQHTNLPPESSRGNAEAMGNARSSELQRSKWQELCGTGKRFTDADRRQIRTRQTQPSLGRDPHGSADWMDYAELYTTCDNRTDELRLLGNGVVPSTAERAFRTLLEELYEQNT